VVVYLGAGFQPDVEKAAASLARTVRRADLLTAPAVGLLSAPAVLGNQALAGGKDPNVWLDPVRMKAMAAAVTDLPGTVDPGHADAHRGNLHRLGSDLDTLDAQLRYDLTGCTTAATVTSHAAFGYFAARYRLRHVPIAGISPDRLHCPPVRQVLS
jgi:zinc transport system substrate-binding protein